MGDLTVTAGATTAVPPVRPARVAVAEPDPNAPAAGAASPEAAAEAADVPSDDEQR